MTGAEHITAAENLLRAAEQHQQAQQWQHANTFAALATAHASIATALQAQQAHRSSGRG